VAPGTAAAGGAADAVAPVEQQQQEEEEQGSSSSRVRVRRAPRQPCCRRCRCSDTACQPPGTDGRASMAWQ